MICSFLLSCFLSFPFLISNHLHDTSSPLLYVSRLQLERDKWLKISCSDILDCSANTGLLCLTCPLCPCHGLLVPPLNLLSRGLPRKDLHCPPISQELSGFLEATVCQEYSSRDLRKKVCMNRGRRRSKGLHTLCLAPLFTDALAAGQAGHSSTVTKMLYVL